MAMMLFDPERLASLRRQLAPGQLPFGHDFWARWLPSVDLDQFRGRDYYLSQNPPREAYANFAEQLRLKDDWHLLDALTEDDAFGVVSFEVDGKVLSRDLLDSIEEIYYLRDRLNWQQNDSVTVLDVGAGYGRLAHRLSVAMPNSTSWSSDAIAESVWLCESYLGYRGVDERRAHVVPCVELPECLKGTHIDVAIAVHSWSECSSDAIQWWAGTLRQLAVPAIMYVAGQGPPEPTEILKAEGYHLTDARQGDLDSVEFRFYSAE